MRQTIVVIVGALLLLALALSPSTPALLAAVSGQSATPTPAAEAEPTATPVAEAEAAPAEADAEAQAHASAAEPTVADLLARLESLEATVADLHATRLQTHADDFTQANAVNTAVYFLDSAGLHGLDVRLNEKGIIEPGDAGQVAQVARLFTTVEWPEGLAEEAAALYETLTALSAALRDDDLAAAAPLATQAHEDQHDFSHHAQAWLAGSVSYDQANGVNTAVYLLDGAGLHGIDVRLNETGEILPGDSGQVGRVGRLLAEVAWPKGLIVEATGLQQTLAALSAALGEDDGESAAALAIVAHADQHHFSHHAQEWLAEVVGHGLADAPGQVNRVNTLVYLLDRVDVHGLAERLAEEQVIEPWDRWRMAQLARLLTTVDWPEELAEDATALYETLTALSAALADDNLATAAPLAEEAHDVQHDFSEAAQEWLAAQGM